MQMQLSIPSFNPSLSRSRRQQILISQPDNNNDPSSSYNFNRRLFHMGQSSHKTNNNNNSEQISYKVNSTEQLWEPIYNQQYSMYKNLTNKYAILEESIRLNRQALSLANSQYIENEERIVQIGGRCKLLTQKAKLNEEKITAISQRCQQAKAAAEVIRGKVQQQQVIIIEEDRHITQLQARIGRMGQQMEGIKQQLSEVMDKEKQYYQIVEQNDKMMEELSKMKKEANFTKIKIDRDWSEEESMLRKMKELEKIIRGKEKNNRELGKRLVQAKKMNPQALNMIYSDKNAEKGSKVKEIVKNIKQMEQEYGRLQQQIFEISQKIETTTEKMQQKIKSVEILKMKQKSRPTQEEQPEYEKSKQLNEIYVPHYEVKSQQERSKPTLSVMKKPSGYRVIESEQNEHFVFPKATSRNESNPNDKNGSRGFQKGQNLGSHQLEYEDRYSQDMTVHKNQQSQKDDRYSNQNSDKVLQIDENLKQLVQKFQKYKNNSLFRH